MVPFTFKYMPKNSAEIVGQEKALAELKEFIINYKKKKPRAAILYGPIGTGKTSSASFIRALSSRWLWGL